jgi:hypothetical protein
MELLQASLTDGGPEAFYDPTSNGPLNWKYYTINNIWQECGHPWISVHPKCLEIARRVVDFRNAKAGNTIDADTDDVPATNLGRLYEIYRARCDAQCSALGASLMTPHSTLFGNRTSTSIREFVMGRSVA